MPGRRFHLLRMHSGDSSGGERKAEDWKEVSYSEANRDLSPMGRLVIDS